MEVAVLLADMIVTAVAHSDLSLLPGPRVVLLTTSMVFFSLEHYLHIQEPQIVTAVLNPAPQLFNNIYHTIQNGLSKNGHGEIYA